jgi:NAD(P)-dependent dehydrogenase (short-subunit alcohol dehydrogenase family)
MVKQGGGRIINVTSVVDIQPIAELSAYVTAKGGILGLTKTLAVELGPLGITVNALSPGATDTPLNQVAYTPEVRRNYNSGSRSATLPRPRRWRTRSSSWPPTRLATSTGTSSGRRGSS